MLLDAGELLPLMESFYSIQGEGYFSGSPAFFLRIEDVMLVVIGVM